MRTIKYAGDGQYNPVVALLTIVEMRLDFRGLVKGVRNAPVPTHADQHHPMLAATRAPCLIKASADCRLFLAASTAPLRWQGRRALETS